MELLMEEEEIGVDGLNMSDFESNQKENFELASDINATDDKNMGLTLENQAEDSSAEEEYDDEEEEEEDTEETHTLRFEGEIDPLALTEDGAIECLEQMHEYEALAAKKRKENLNYNHPGMPPEKKLRQEEFSIEKFEELMAGVRHGMRRNSKKIKKRGRRKGSKKNVSPEITRKLGDATLYYAHGRYEEAIHLLREIIQMSPNLPDPFHTLGLVYNAIGDKRKSVDFYMLAVILKPKDASLWKLLVTLSLEQGYRGQALHCLGKAIKADPEDMGLRYHHASLFLELGEHQKAAESYEQIWKLRPKNVEALKTAATVWNYSSIYAYLLKLCSLQAMFSHMTAALSCVSLQLISRMRVSDLMYGCVVLYLK